MVVAELVRRSPIRLLERVTHGGVAPGEFGVIAGPRGVGKTACLVHLAIDRLLQQRKVLHVSFAADTAHLSVWYDDILGELVRRYQLDGAAEIHDSIIANRVLSNFATGNGCWERVQRTIRSLASNAGFIAHTVVVDGYPFAAEGLAGFRDFHAFAAELQLEVWFSASVDSPMSDALDAGVTQTLGGGIGECAVIIVLVDRGTYIHLRVLKNHGYPPEESGLKLDPHFLLIDEQYDTRGSG